MIDETGLECRKPELAELIARYEHDALTSEERTAFEAHLLECDKCFVELERGSSAAGEMRAEASKYLRLLRGVEAPQKAAPATASRIFRRPARFRGWFAVPALALVVLALGVFGLSRLDDPRRLATFPEEMVAGDLLRGGVGDDAIEQLMSTGAGYFETRHWADAERCFRAALVRSPDLAEASYLAGLSSVHQGQVEQAIADFAMASKSTDDSLRQKATWSLANAMLRAGHLEDAKLVFSEVESEGGQYGALAHDLLQRLGR